MANISEEKQANADPGQEGILVTEDRIRLCLGEHLKKLEMRKGWIAPLVVFVILAVVIATADTFRAQVWEIIFLVGFFVSLTWLAVSVLQARHSANIEDVIQELKGNSIEPLSETISDQLDGPDLTSERGA